MDKEVVIALGWVLAILGLLVIPLVALGLTISLLSKVKRLAQRQEHLLVTMVEMLRRRPAEGAAPATPPAPAPAAPPRPTPEAARASVLATLEVKAPAAPPSPAPPPSPAAPVPAAPPPLARVAAPPPSSVVQPAPTPSAVSQAWRRLWSWILMGGEERAKGMTREWAIATWWLLVLGIGAIASCVIYFLRWSYERGLIGPEGRVAITVLFGMGLVVAGLRLLGRKYHLIGQGFLGGGILTLYFSAYAAGPLYDLVPLLAAFGLMSLVTVAAGVLAVTTDSLLTAMIGLAGGYLTPVLLRTEEPNLPGLYTYILLLGLGIMGVARGKRWPGLNYAGFLCTYGLFLASMSAYERTDFPLAMSFLSAFFVVHSWIAFVRGLGRGERASAWDVAHLAANAVVFAGFGYTLIRDAHGRSWPAALSLSLAAFYIVHVWVFLQRELKDRRLLVTLLTLAGAFSAWTLPLVFEKETLTLTLALLAFAFLWAGRRLGSGFVQNLAHLVYLIVFYRAAVMDFPHQFAGAGDPNLPAADYLAGLAGRLWSFGVIIASVVAAFVSERRAAAAARAAGGAPRIAGTGDLRRVTPERAAAGVFYWATVVFIFVLAYLEANRLFVYWEPFRLPVLTALWCGLAAYALWRLLAADGDSPGLFAVVCVALAVATVKITVLDLASWGWMASWTYGVPYTAGPILGRLLDFGALVGMFAAGWALLGVRRGSRGVAAAFGYSALALFFLYATLEWNTFLWRRLPEFQRGGLSVLWALFAIAFIAGGIWRAAPSLRYVGLALFLVVVGKVFLVDLARMPMIFRVLAFLVVGVALLLGSFAYLYAGRKFQRERGGGPPE